MNLLYITTNVPWPLNSGGNQAFYMMADYIRHCHQLSILFKVRNSEEKKAVEVLKRKWDNVTFYVLDESSEVYRKSDRLLESLSWYDSLMYRMFDFISHSVQRKMRRKIRKIDFVKSNSTLYEDLDGINHVFCDYVYEISRKGFDAIQIEFYENLPFVYLLPRGVKKIFVHHEIRFVRNEIELSLFKKQSAAEKMLLEQHKAREIAALDAYDTIITLTEKDKEKLAQYIPQDKIYVSPAITNAAEMKNLPFKPTNGLAFVGSCAHFPNADAIIWYIEKVLPVLRQKCKNIPCLNIIGNWNQKMIKGMDINEQEVKLTGFVPDLQKYLNGKISIVPIRIGSGMRMKILDSVAAGSPIVTTSVGCEGLPMINEKNCLIADTAEDFADAIIRMIQDKEMQQIFAQTAQNIEKGMLDNEVLQQKRCAIYDF